uniref:ribosomal protein S3 n=1 Tax=Malassezia caprae TaxID=1381934 RepID=UPI003002748D|nr:ribosomal protein S3 [Malassezia caprae]
MLVEFILLNYNNFDLGLLSPFVNIFISIQLILLLLKNYLYMKFTNTLYKNKRIEGNDSKLVDILTSSVLQNKNHFLSTNNRTLTNLEKVATQILQSYFGNIQTVSKKMVWNVMFQLIF